MMNIRPIVCLSAALLLVACGFHDEGAGLSSIETRGNFHDVRGRALTDLQMQWRVAVNVVAVRRLGVDGAQDFVDALATRLGIAPQVLMGFAERQQLAEWQLQQRMSTEEVASLRVWFRQSPWRYRPALLRFERTPTRVYPAGESMAALVGFVNTNDGPVEGLEFWLDKSLRKGVDVRLSIDSGQQQGLMEVLEESRRTLGAEDAAATAIDLRTGQVIAMVSLPGFDPADISTRIQQNMRVKPVTEIFQLGPMLQPFLLDAAQERLTGTDLAVLDEAFVAGRSDAGVQMAQALGLEATRAAVSQYELGRRAGTGLPGEADPRLLRDGTDDLLLREFGEGAAVAPTLARYAYSFARLVGGRPVGPLVSVVGESDPAAVPAPGRVGEAGATIRKRMVERARVHDPAADFGGMWSSWVEKSSRAQPPRHLAAAVFAPAESPTHLVVLKMRTGTTSATPEAGLDAARALLSRLVAPAPAPTLVP
jgi:hypothetical protein